MAGRRSTRADSHASQARPLPRRPTWWSRRRVRAKRWPPSAPAAPHGSVPSKMPPASPRRWRIEQRRHFRCWGQSGHGPFGRSSLSLTPEPDIHVLTGPSSGQLIRTMAVEVATSQCLYPAGPQHRCLSTGSVVARPRPQVRDMRLSRCASEYV